MKLAISNIAWSAEQDKIMYEKMTELGFTGLEIAPTRIFPEHPYEHLREAVKWRKELHSRYGFEIPSMQSIWYGRTESIFGTPEEREALQRYTYQAIDFAAAIGCQNLVFGCPKNRCVPEGVNPDTAIPFFQKIAEYAVSKNVVIGLEANPTIYHTNYINTTAQALDLIEKVSSPGFRLNLDIGTMLYNQEDVSQLVGKVHYISHVHISEPMLKLVNINKTHLRLANILYGNNYDRYISIEIGRKSNLEQLTKVMKNIGTLFDLLEN